MRLLSRNNDVIDGSNNFEKLQSLSNFPVFMGTVSHHSSEDKMTNMDWYISKTTGMIQLKELIPLDILYSETHTSGEIGKIWDDHHNAFCKFLLKVDHKKIFEIGGANGILADKYHREKPDVDWTIIEPNPRPQKKTKAKFIKGFFGDNLSYNFHEATIVHSHTFEHIYFPDDFMKDISKNIEKNNYLFFSIPNIKKMLLNNYTNALNFEHTFYLNEVYVEYFLKKYGFEIIKKDFYLEDHSIFYSARKISSNYNLKFTENLYDQNKILFNNFINFYKNLIDSINLKIKQQKGKVYLFGAHIFSQYLIAMGLDISRIEYILDNDISKQNKRLYGTNLIVQSPEILKNNKSRTAIILRAGVYNKEIRDNIDKNINSNIEYL